MKLSVSLGDGQARPSLPESKIVEVRISDLAYEVGELPQAANVRPTAGRRSLVGALALASSMARSEWLRRHSSGWWRGTSSSLTRNAKQPTVSNPMVVLCSDQPASPIVNAGTLYS